MLAGVLNLRDLGTRTRLYDDDGNDLGFCDLPRPVASGDVAALEDVTFRVIGVHGVVSQEPLHRLRAIARIFRVRCQSAPPKTRADYLWPFSRTRPRDERAFPSGPAFVDDPRATVSQRCGRLSALDSGHDWDTKRGFRGLG
jgi:hypothetical protein